MAEQKTLFFKWDGAVKRIQNVLYSGEHGFWFKLDDNDRRFLNEYGNAFVMIWMRFAEENHGCYTAHLNMGSFLLIPSFGSFELLGWDLTDYDGETFVATNQRWESVASGQIYTEESLVVPSTE